MNEPTATSTKVVRFQIQIAGYTRTIGVRGSRRYATMYVIGASWKSNGNTPDKIRWSVDATKATTFSKTMAEAIVKAYRHLTMSIVPVEVVK